MREVKSIAESQPVTLSIVTLAPTENFHCNPATPVRISRNHASGAEGKIVPPRPKCSYGSPTRRLSQLIAGAMCFFWDGSHTGAVTRLNKNSSDTIPIAFSIGLGLGGTLSVIAGLYCKLFSPDLRRTVEHERTVPCLRA